MPERLSRRHCPYSMQPTVSTSPWQHLYSSVVDIGVSFRLAEKLRTVSVPSGRPPDGRYLLPSGGQRTHSISRGTPVNPRCGVAGKRLRGVFVPLSLPLRMTAIACRNIAQEATAFFPVLSHWCDNLPITWQITRFQQGHSTLFAHLQLTVTANRSAVVINKCSSSSSGEATLSAHRQTQLVHNISTKFNSII